MVFPFRLWRFSGTINYSHCALANAGDEATARGTGRARIWPKRLQTTSCHLRILRRRPEKNQNGCQWRDVHSLRRSQRLLIPASENMDEHCLAFGIVSRNAPISIGAVMIRNSGFVVPGIHSVKLHVFQPWKHSLCPGPSDSRGTMLRRSAYMPLPAH